MVNWTKELAISTTKMLYKQKGGVTSVFIFRGRHYSCEQILHELENDTYVGSAYIKELQKMEDEYNNPYKAV